MEEIRNNYNYSRQRANSGTKIENSCSYTAHLGVHQLLRTGERVSFFFLNQTWTIAIVGPNHDSANAKENSIIVKESQWDWTNSIGIMNTAPPTELTTQSQLLYTGLPYRVSFLKNRNRGIPFRIYPKAIHQQKTPWDRQGVRWQP